MKLETTYNSRRNFLIDFVRVMFAVQIVMLHTSPFIEYNSYLSYIVCHVYSRLAVPFFAAISGYYLFQDYSIENALLYTKKILITYVFWNSLSCLIDICFGYTEGNIFVFLVNAFLVKGQHALWYMLALIYTVLLTIVVYKFNVRRSFLFGGSLVLLLIGIATNAYGNLFFKIDSIKYAFGFLNTDMSTGLPFVVIPYFAMGWLLKCHEKTRREKNNWRLFSLCVIAYTVEVFFITVTDIHFSNISCLMTYPTIYFLISALLCSKKKFKSNLFLLLSPIANIIYYAHSLLLYLIPSVLKVFFDTPISNTLLFLVIISVLVPLSCILAYNKKGIIRVIV